MMLVLNLPIEPIEGRYSILWDQWFKEAFSRNKIDHITIEGKTSSTKFEPAEGKFLDPIATFEWKFSQLQQAVEFLSVKHSMWNKFVVFLHDGWFPGIECFRYIREMEKLDIKVCSFWHAGAYDPTDLLGIRGMHSWVGGSEQTWAKLSDAIFIGSEYSKQKLVNAFPVLSNRIETIYPIGNPVEVPKFSGKVDAMRENIVVWPHRISEDKHPEVFERLKAEPSLSGAKFIRTHDDLLSKSEYFKLLSKSKVAVSTASHENFGIAMVEAAMLGCYPICPNALAYKEVMDPQWLYDSYEQLEELVLRALQRETTYSYVHTHKFNQIMVTDKICEVIKGL